MVIRILTSFLIWVVCYIPLILVSAVVVPIMLLCGWQGYTTIFGNYLYGRNGNKALTCTTFLCSCRFLIWRNPISNFGKFTIAAPADATWAWLYDVPMFWNFHVKAGWKKSDARLPNAQRTFLFRPYWRQDGLG